MTGQGGRGEREKGRKGERGRGGPPLHPIRNSEFGIRNCIAGSRDDRRTEGERGSAALKAVAWVLLGAVAMLLLVVDPFGVSPVDGWLRIERTADGRHEGGAPHDDVTELWTCGMHPEVIQDEPGSCPICHMDLVPLRQDDGHPPGHQHELWTCPMHPEILEDEPGSCPICKMDLVKVKDDMGMDSVPVSADEAEAAADQGAVVTIDAAVQQNMNVVTESVSRRDISHEIRTVGSLGYDQERMVSVTTKYPGFIEKTYVNYIGQPVRKGEPLFEIYAPELVQTEQELLAALRYARATGVGAR